MKLLLRCGEICSSDHRVSVRLSGDNIRDFLHQTLQGFQIPPSQVILTFRSEESLLCPLITLGTNTNHSRSHTDRLEISSEILIRISCTTNDNYQPFHLLL